jgi:nucleotide-binding universal stress UspA family protein
MSKIVIGVDAGERSEDAIAFGGRLDAATGANVVIAAAYHFTNVPSRIDTALHDEARRAAEAMRARLGADAELRIVPGSSPAHALHDVAYAERADLVIVGSSHTGRAGRVLPGSTGERLIHGAPCSVAIAPNGYREHADTPLRRIGVAYNATSEARAAANAAAGLARALEAELEVIAVVAPEAYTSLAMLSAPNAVAVADDAHNYVQGYLDAIVAELPGAAGVRLDGIPFQALATRSEGLDLLVTGSRGYGPLRSVLVGGCSGPLLRTAACPVVVVPRGVEAPLEGLLAAAAA